MSNSKKLDNNFFEKLLDGEWIFCYTDLEYAQVMAAAREIRERHTYFRGSRCTGTAVYGNGPWLVKVMRQ